LLFLPPATRTDSDFRLAPKSDITKLENLIFNQRAVPFMLRIAAEETDANGLIGLLRARRERPRRRAAEQRDELAAPHF
jgi:hypothetical protein